MVTPLADGGYSLEETGIWVEVGNISIRIHKTDEGVVVDLYPKGDEHEPIASTYAFFDEVSEVTGVTWEEPP